MLKTPAGPGCLRAASPASLCRGRLPARASKMLLLCGERPVPRPWDALCCAEPQQASSCWLDSLCRLCTMSRPCTKLEGAACSASRLATAGCKTATVLLASATTFTAAAIEASGCSGTPESPILPAMPVAVASGKGPLPVNASAVTPASVNSRMPLWLKKARAIPTTCTVCSNLQILVDTPAEEAACSSACLRGKNGCRTVALFAHLVEMVLCGMCSQRAPQHRQEWRKERLSV